MNAQEAIQRCRDIPDGMLAVDILTVRLLLKELDRRAELYREARKASRPYYLILDSKWDAETERRLAGE